MESSPFIWDPLALAELVHRQAAGDTAEGSDFLGRTSGPARHPPPPPHACMHFVPLLSCPIVSLL